MSNPYASPPSDRRSGQPGVDGRDPGAGPGTETGTGTGAGTGTGTPEDSRAGQPPAGRTPAGRPPSGPSPQGQPGRAVEPRRPPDPKAVRLASRRVMHFGLVMLAALVTATLPLPWQAAGLAFAVGALVLGVRALRTVWVSGLRGTLVPVLAVGLVFAALMTVSLGTMLALWPLQMERQDCLRDALTITATEACETQFQEGLTERLDQMSQRSRGGAPAD